MFAYMFDYLLFSPSNDCCCSVAELFTLDVMLAAASLATKEASKISTHFFGEITCMNTIFLNTFHHPYSPRGVFGNPCLRLPGGFDAFLCFYECNGSHGFQPWPQNGMWAYSDSLFGALSAVLVAFGPQEFCGWN